MAAILVSLAAGFLWIAAPGFMGGANPYEPWLPLIALAGVVVGFVWMVRIYRADPEPDQKIWRYRDR